MGKDHGPGSMEEAFKAAREAGARVLEDLTNHPNVGVRWQAQMEEHLLSVRQLTHEAMLPGLDPKQARFRAELARAHATCSMALAIANTGSDLELALTKIAVEGTGQ